MQQQRMHALCTYGVQIPVALEDQLANRQVIERSARDAGRDLGHAPDVPRLAVGISLAAVSTDVTLPEVRPSLRTCGHADICSVVEHRCDRVCKAEGCNMIALRKDVAKHSDLRIL
jgi:hypothetical protein